MQLYEVIENTNKHTLPPFLVFTGSEYAIIELYIDKICEQYKFERANITTIKQIVKKQRVISLLGEKKVYVCKYDFDALKTDYNKQFVYSSVGNNLLILVVPSVDKRGKFYKTFESNIVEFVEQDIKTVKLMLSDKTTLNDKNVSRLINGCGGNYSKILLELNKIKILSKVRNCSEDTAYTTLLSEGTIVELQDTKLQKFVDLFLRKDNKCFELYENLLENGENNMIILSWLYNAVRNQLVVQTVQRPTQDTTGLSYFFIKECLERTGYYTTNELLTILERIKYVEQGIKSGIIEDVNSVSYVLVNAL